MPVLSLVDFASVLPPKRPLLGLDPGSVVIGIAVSDPMRRVASPLTSLTRAKKFAGDAAAIVKIIHERQVGGLVIGLPKNMDGTEGPAAQSARAFARNLVERGHLPDPDIPILFWDERFSSAAVERMLIADDMTRKRREAVIDKAAAAYILQGVLDALAMR